MGARPRFFTVSLAITPDISERWIVDFHDGLTERAKAFGADLLGGDLSGTKERVVISITAVGESLNRKVVYRSGGKPGDFLYVTGILGRSAAGLKLLQEQKTRGRCRAKALRAHRDPDPRCAAGLWLAQSGLVRCMMDLSDGLSADLPRICAASRVGAEIQMEKLPAFRESVLWGCDPVQLALHGGEDYELLFSVPASKRSRLEKIYPANLPPLFCIGRLTSNPEKIWILVNDGKVKSLLPRHGWDHFKPPGNKGSDSASS
jgi:thiamine-monophosphate kinase